MQKTVADMTDAELDAEFDRFADLRDAYQEAMKEIREEKVARLDRENARLRAELAASPDMPDARLFVRDRKS